MIEQGTYVCDFFDCATMEALISVCETSLCLEEAFHLRAPIESWHILLALYSSFFCRLTGRIDDPSSIDTCYDNYGKSKGCAAGCCWLPSANVLLAAVVMKTEYNYSIETHVQIHVLSH